MIFFRSLFVQCLFLMLVSHPLFAKSGESDQEKRIIFEISSKVVKAHIIEVYGPSQMQKVEIGSGLFEYQSAKLVPSDEPLFRNIDIDSVIHDKKRKWRKAQNLVLAAIESMKTEIEKRFPAYARFGGIEYRFFILLGNASFDSKYTTENQFAQDLYEALDAGMDEASGIQLKIWPKIENKMLSIGRSLNPRYGNDQGGAIAMAIAANPSFLEWLKFHYSK